MPDFPVDKSNFLEQLIIQVQKYSIFFVIFCMTDILKYNCRFAEVIEIWVLRTFLFVT